MQLIVAVDKNWGIGKDNELLVRLPGDQKFFRETTMGHLLIMGRLTLESMPGGKPLPGRETWLLSSTITEHPDCRVFHDLKELLHEIAIRTPGSGKEIFVCGGTKVYEELLPYCDRALVTKIDAEFPADRTFPNLDEMPEWKVLRESDVREEKGISYRFCEYVRK
ncbi:MAG: dihydrofolate reductase [Firmicutes bacterium]|nr:dihydrofolate reductase [Bacillota bacterium]